MAATTAMETAATAAGGRALDWPSDWALLAGAVVISGGKEDGEGRGLVGTAVVLGTVLAAAVLAAAVLAASVLAAAVLAAAVLAAAVLAAALEYMSTAAVRNVPLKPPAKIAKFPADAAARLERGMLS
jgi:hypothetical protein